jgi:hypothetical protein
MKESDMDLDTLNHCISMDDWAGAICIVKDCHMVGSVKNGLQFFDNEENVLGVMNTNSEGYYGIWNNEKFQANGYSLQARIDVLQKMYMSATYNTV